MERVMIVDGGARGHALAKTYRSKYDVFVAPGNGGIEYNFIRDWRSIPNDWVSEPIKIVSEVSLKDPNSVLEAARGIKPDLVDVAQDDALAAGTVDLLQKHGFNTFGPTREAAQIEWDKAWAREFMQRHNISHPEFKIFKRVDENKAIEYAWNLLGKSKPVYIKATGLYAGKGVIPATTPGEISAALLELKKMGSASETFLVEEGMRGEEFSYYALVKGTDFACFKSAQDNKRVWNGDRGPNTGGMGANSPALVTNGLERRIEDEIIRPTVEGLAAEGRSYNGILYLGGMVCDDGSIKVVEFNSRWGDPECHVILPGLQGKSKDYFNLVTAKDLTSVTKRENGRLIIEQDDLARVCIIGASIGYPINYENIKGRRIFIDYHMLPNDFLLLSAGIKVLDSKMYVNGGRIFSVVSEARNIIEARTRALQAMACFSIEGNGLHYRTDIAWRDVEREQKAKLS